MSMQLHPHHLRNFQSNKRKIAEGKISLSTFIQTTSSSVAALQFYSSKTSNAKLKKKFILYILIYIIWPTFGNVCSVHENYSTVAL